MEDTIKVVSFTGDAIVPLIPEIARLRIEVFAEYPFLYEGELAYEEKYLKKFTAMRDAIVVVAFDREKIVGLSTGYPFCYDSEEFQQIFRSSGRDPKDYYCFGESVLQKRYRGTGIGKQFFDEREGHVRRLSTYRSLCFYTAMRPAHDPKRPKDYRPLDEFWKKRGFVKHPELVGEISYPEIGEKGPTPKKMVFWIKKN